MDDAHRDHRVMDARSRKVGGDGVTIRLSVIVAVTGRPVKTEAFLLRMLRAADQAPAGLQVVFVLDGRHWSSYPSVQRATLENPRLVVEVMDVETGLPAILFGRGADLSQGGHLQFCDPASLWSEAVTTRLLAGSHMEGPGATLYVGSRRRLDRCGFGHEPTPSLLADWMLYEAVVPLSYVAIPRSLFEELGGFDTSPLLQERSDHEFLVRLTRRTTCVYLGLHEDDAIPEEPSILGGSSRPFPVAEDVARRYIARAKALPPNHSALTGALCSDPTFLADLPRRTAAFLDRHHARRHRRPDPVARRSPEVAGDPLRITITGGAYEYHHNWLCFYNYLQHLQGTGFATYQALHDRLLRREDLIGSDIVFLSRCRSDNVAEIIAFCNEARIPVVYMIDDNWLTVGQDWPAQYADMFRPGSPPYDNFVYAIENCDAVLTYNRLLAEDVEPYAQRLVTLPNSVDLERFEAIERRTNERFVVGYAGSPRFDDASFDALVEIGRRRGDVDIFLMGSSSEALDRRFEGCRLIRVPHQPYDLYVETLRQVGADILIAPLDDSRTSRSKCPNKYLEITAAGAVGVYTAIEPYVWHVRDGVSGRLVYDGRSVGAWIDAIESLLDRRSLAAMHAAARTDVAASHRASSVAEQFRRLVLDLVAAGSQGRRSTRSPARVRDARVAS
jgi:glycosyltransferase involved in cell wall biosynthesis